MKYLKEEFNTVKQIISNTNYAILNIISDHVPSGKSILVEPYYLDAENKLICFTNERLPSTLHDHEFQVIIKCINRKKGNFIRMTGLASFESRHPKNAVLKTVLTIKVLQMAWFFKHTGKVEFYQ